MRTTHINIFLKASQKTPTNHAKLLTKLFPLQPVATAQTSDSPYCCRLILIHHPK